ncbi:MAG: DegT/DnrJ/EryC1/StrS family aminotransferase [Saprospiraceae bacterium]
MNSRYILIQRIPNMIYYQYHYKQKAFQHDVPSDMHLPVTEMLCEQVISLPIHTEMRKINWNI